MMITLKDRVPAAKMSSAMTARVITRVANLSQASSARC